MKVCSSTNALDSRKSLLSRHHFAVWIFAIAGRIGSANEIEAKSLYPLMHTFHLSPLLLLHFHHLSLGLYPIIPVWNYYSNFLCPRVFSWSSKWDELGGLGEVVARFSQPPPWEKADVRSISRGRGAEKWDGGWWEKRGSPVGQPLALRGIGDFIVIYFWPSRK